MMALLLSSRIRARHARGVMDCHTRASTKYGSLAVSSEKILWLNSLKSGEMSRAFLSAVNNLSRLRHCSDDVKKRFYKTSASNLNDTKPKSTAHKLKRVPKKVEGPNRDTSGEGSSRASEEGEKENPSEVKDPPARQEYDAKSTPGKNEPISTAKSSDENMGRYHIHEFAPRIVVVGVGGAGSNAISHMMSQQALKGVDFVAINTDAQHLATLSQTNAIPLQIGQELTGGLGCGANPDAGRLAAQESQDMIAEVVATDDTHMVFITAGMGGGTGTGAAPVVSEICYSAGILTVGVVTKPFLFEGRHRMNLALEGLASMKSVVDSLLVIPNQNLFKLVDQHTTLQESFKLADNVLLEGVRGITDLMTSPGLINLDFADVQAVMHGMGNAMLGTGQSEGTGGEGRSLKAADMALQNPLMGDMDISTAKGMLVNITGGSDMTLFEVDQAAQRIISLVQDDENANIIFGSAFDASLEGSIKVSIVATGMDDIPDNPHNSSTQLPSNMGGSGMMRR